MKLLVQMTLALVASASITGSAFAENSKCTTVPKANWMSMDAVKSKAIDLGYDVRSIRREGSCYEIKAMINGKRREVVFNPADGQLVEGNEQN